MPLSKPERQAQRISIYRGLKHYSAAEVDGNNHCLRLFSSIPSFARVLEETLSELLPMSAGHELHIAMTNELQNEQTQTLVFQQQELFIGRSSENDIALPLQSISRRHARIFVRESSFYVEDLRSISGTYVNRKKLDAMRPCRLRSGDEVLMFPYVLRIASKDLWVRDETIAVKTISPPQYVEGQLFASGFGPEQCLFELQVHSQTSAVLLAIDRSLLRTMLARLLHDDMVDIVQADSDLVGFIALTIMERINRELELPLTFSLRPLQNRFPENVPEAGLQLETMVRMQGMQGLLRLFLPSTVLTHVARAGKARSSYTGGALCWRLLLCVGLVTLSGAEATQVEPGDTLIYNPDYRLLLPAGKRADAPRQGWRIARDETDRQQFVLMNFEQWSASMPEEQEEIEAAPVASEKANLSALPVQIHVVLTRIEMDLQELEQLTTGSILQLAEGTGSTVQLVSSGSMIGTGELIDLDDERLGVKVLQWREGQ